VADDLALAARHAPRRLARYLVGLLVGLVVLLLLFARRGELDAVLRELRRVSPAWAAAAIAAEACSLVGYAVLQHRALRAGGARIPLPSLVMLTLANNAIANTLPGEPVVSSAYRFRYYTRSGVSKTTAGWTIFTVIIAQAIGMALLLLAGVLVSLASGASASQVRVGALGLVIVVAAGAILVRRDLVLRLAAAGVRAARRRPVTADSMSARLEAAFDRMRQIPLGRRSAAAIIAVAVAVWVADFGCLLCSLAAVHAAIPWHGVLLAYGVAQVAGSLPIVPGGLGIIEGSLAVIMAAEGAERASALAATLVFRAVSFWLGIAVGWIAVALIARSARPGRPPGPGHAHSGSRSS
jgi:uncharacterized protein (TIRG00374 family)